MSSVIFNSEHHCAATVFTTILKYIRLVAIFLFFHCHVFATHRYECSSSPVDLLGNMAVMVNYAIRTTTHLGQSGSLDQL